MNKVSKEEKKRIINFVEERLNKGKSFVIFAEEGIVANGNPINISSAIVFGLDIIRKTSTIVYDSVKHGLEYIESPEYNKEDKEVKDNE